MACPATPDIHRNSGWTDSTHMCCTINWRTVQVSEEGNVHEKVVNRAQLAGPGSVQNSGQ